MIERSLLTFPTVSPAIMLYRIFPIVSCENSKLVTVECSKQALTMVPPLLFVKK